MTTLTAPNYTTLIGALLVDGWTTEYSEPTRPGALAARILTSPTGALRLRLITTGASVLGLLEPACAPHCENAEHVWQVRAEDPDPAVYLAAAHAAHHTITTGTGSPTPRAALSEHGWLATPAEDLDGPGYGYITPDHTRSFVHHSEDQTTEIALANAGAHSSPITATANTPDPVLIALALAPTTATARPAVNVDGEQVDNQTRADWAREILQTYADHHYTLDGDRDFDLNHGFAAEQALRDMITNGLHLLDVLGFAEHDRETTLRYAYGMYVEERDEAASDEQDAADAQTAGSTRARLD
jgi:hypothetical protein